MIMDNLLEWVRGFARCHCGEQLDVKESRHIGNATYLSSTFSNCDKELRVCSSSVGCVTRASPEKKACPYDVHDQLVKATLHSSSGYVGI